MAKVARARSTLEIAWSAHAETSFIIGSSLIGGTDIIGFSAFDVVFSGTYDNVSHMLRSAAATRGRDASRQFVTAGSASFVLYDELGLLNVENAASPLQGVLVDHYQPIRWRGYLPATPTTPRGLFFGFIEKIEWVPSGRVAGAGYATLICKDLLHWLSQARPIIPATGPTTTGAAIGKILDYIGWLEPTGRSLAVGDVLPDFEADGTISATSLIEDLLEAERGIFVIDGEGVATYQDRVARQVATSVATISSEMKTLHPGVDRSQLRNRVRVKRTQNDYVATAEDAASRSLIGDRDLEDIETAYLNSDTQADALASFVLAQVKTSIPPMRDLKIDNRTEALLTQCLLRELGDVMTITAVGADVSASDYMIERLDLRSDARRNSFEALYLLSQHAAITPFRIGTSQLVATAPGHVFIY